MTYQDSAREIWLPVKGYEGLYEISNRGRFKSLARKYHPAEQILKLATLPRGYKTVCLCKDSLRRTKLVSRLVATSFIPNPDGLPEVNHKDGDKTNNFDWNLEWCTAQENIIHAFKTGLQISLKGEDHNMAKLKEYEVLEIRRLYEEGCISQRELGKRYHVHRFTIWDILKRKTWRHI